jgi:hypothetical protein
VRAARAVALVLIGAMLPLAGWPADDVWARSYDSATQIRYIPLELILGAPWDGQWKISMPKGSFIEGVARDPSTWRGPVQWQHPDNGEALTVYERGRHGVGQRFALRRDGAAIGRVSDSRFGISSCEEEAKYPLGEWKQGEMREFEYRCWYGSGEKKRSAQMVTIITIENADFSYSGVDHSLRIHWVLKRKDGGQQMDNRRYVFSPGLGIVAVR